jgi:hypothetical protein
MGFPRPGRLIHSKLGCTSAWGRIGIETGIGIGIGGCFMVGLWVGGGVVCLFQVWFCFFLRLF